ncbi:hypothetical protein AKO1_005707 [Acrasis kona]|uniref:Uncharacterized protein n=1 Tax=Acrasis kona TaxID=1008807 RepID=A0AAW2YKC2_9EUKA
MFLRSIARRSRPCVQSVRRLYATEVAETDFKYGNTTYDINANPVLYGEPGVYSSTESVIAEIDKVMGAVDTYKSKYPNVDPVDTYLKLLKQHTPVKNDPGS